MFVLRSWLRILLFPTLILTGTAIKGVFAQTPIPATWKRGWNKTIYKTYQNISQNCIKIATNVCFRDFHILNLGLLLMIGHVTDHVTIKRCLAWAFLEPVLSLGG